MAVQIILKNSSIEDKRPNASQLTNGEISLNYNENGAFLCCTDSSGEVQQVGGVKIDDDAPDAPVKQTLWFKPSTLTLSVYDGDKWLPIAGGGGGGGGGGGDITQIIGNDGIDADTVAGIVTLDVELAGGDDGLEFKSSKLSATLASATDLGSVKVGDNINVTAGKISVAKADASTFGVVKIGNGIDIDGDGSISIDVPTTTTYRGSCDLNNSPTGQINPDPALKGDAYINSADATTVDAGWTGITGSAQIGDLAIFDGATWDLIPLGNGGNYLSLDSTAPAQIRQSFKKTTFRGNVELGVNEELVLSPNGSASFGSGNIALYTDGSAEFKGAVDLPSINFTGTGSDNKIEGEGIDIISTGSLGSIDLRANKSLLLNATGSEGYIFFRGNDTTSSYRFRRDGSTDEGYLDFQSLTGTRTYTYPDKTGTIALTSDISAQKPPVISSATAPTGDDAVEGNLWFNSNDGRTYVYYKDGDSSQWVDASPNADPVDTSLWLEAGGYLSPKTGTNGVDIGGGNIKLDSAGSGKFRYGGTGVGIAVVQEEGFSGYTLSLNDNRPTSTHKTRLRFSASDDGNRILSSNTGGTGRDLFFDFDDGSNKIGIGGVIPAAPNISLNSDGSSNFSGDMSITTDLVGGKNLVVQNKNTDGRALIRVQNDLGTDSRIDLQIGSSGNTGDSTYRNTDNSFISSANLCELTSRGSSIANLVIGTNSSVPLKLVQNARVRAEIGEQVNIDVDTIVNGDIQSTSQNGAQIGGFRNQLINGNMLIWQRGTDFSPSTPGAATGIQTADRWHCQADQGNIGQLVQVPANSSSLTGCPQEFPYAFGYWDQADISQRSSFIQAVEIPFDTRPRGCGPFTPGQQWTLSCYASADLTAKAAKLDFADSVQDSANTVSYGATASWVEIEAPTATRWGRYAVTFTGSANNPLSTNACMRVNFGPISTVQSSSNFTTNTSRFGVTGCQLEPGSVATPFEHRPIGTELALCQRYYIKFRSSGELVNTATASSSGRCSWPVTLPVPMRISSPTILGTTGLRTQNTASGGGVTTDAWQSASKAHTGKAELVFTASVSGPNNTRLTVHEGANEIQLNAEL